MIEISGEKALPEALAAILPLPALAAQHRHGGLSLGWKTSWMTSCRLSPTSLSPRNARPTLEKTAATSMFRSMAAEMPSLHWAIFAGKRSFTATRSTKKPPLKRSCASRRFSPAVMAGAFFPRCGLLRTGAAAVRRP